MKMIKKLAVLSFSIIYVLSQFLPGLTLVDLGLVDTVEATYTQNNNTGLARIDFIGGLGGISTLNSPQLSLNPTLGQLSYQGTGVGDFLLAPIIPSSFTTWGNLEIDLPVGNFSDITATIYSCTGVMISAPNLSVPFGVLNLATIASGYSCIQPLIQMADGPGPAVTISEIRVKWQPLSFLGINLSAPSTTNACNILSYDLQYSLSFVDDTDILISVPLPVAQSGSYTPSYGQNVQPLFDSATNSGTYTTGGTSFLGTLGQTLTVPANSVYWYFTGLSAGNTGILKFRIRIPCGTENGILYDTQAVGQSVNSTINQSSVVTVQGVSAPAPYIKKTATNDIDVGNNHYAYLPFSNIVNYSIEIANGRNGAGTEDLFNTTIVDNLSAVAASVASCTGLAFADRVSVVDGGVYNTGTNTITWSQPTLSTILELGQTTFVGYSINYAGCNIDGLQFNNTATLSADNLVGLSSSYTVTVLDNISPFGMFAKHIGNTTDLLREYTYEQPFNYYLQAQNPGLTRLEDVIMLDKIPDDQVLNGPITLPNGVVGYVFYTTTGAGLPPTVPPSYTIGTASAGNLGTDWTTTYTPNAKWIAVYIRCLSSTYFPGSSSYCNGAPSAVTVAVPVRMTTPIGQACVDSQRDNIANFTFHAGSNNITNLDTDIVPVVSPVLVQYPASRGVFHPIRPIISVTNPISGPRDIDASGNAVYSMEVTNVGQDTSTSTLVTINIPSIVKNGLTTYPSVQVTNAGGGTVSYNLPQNFVVDLGPLAPGQTRTISFRLSQFQGVVDGTSMTINASVEATDLECGSSTFTASKTTTINGTSSLSAYKTKNLSYISQGDQIEYSLFALNDGNVVATNGFVVDKIPQNTNLISVSTSGSSTNNIQYNCQNCNVYFAPALPQLPSSVNVIDPFTVSQIFANFTPGNQVSPGVWQAPMANAVYVAVEIDNAQGVVPTSELISFGIIVQDAGYQPGETIRNYAGIISDQNLQSITNQVETTLLSNPGLVVDIESSKDILEGCEAFDWYVDYYSDASAINDQTSISVTFPQGFVPTAVQHEWNAYAISGGASPSGIVSLVTGTYATGTLNLNGTYTYTLNVNALKGSGLGSLEGGRLHFIHNVPCGTLSNSVFDATVVGTFSNTQSSGITSDNDLIFVRNADLEIIKNVSIFDPLPGEVIRYTLDLANIGGHEATNVEIVDVLQVGLCYQTGTVAINNQGYSIGEPTIDPEPCNPLTGQILTWSIASGSTFVGPQGTGYLQGFSDHLYITYDVLVNGSLPQGTDLINGVTVYTTNPEDNYLNNYDDEQVVTPYPDPTVTITGPASVLPGDVFDYTITYSNNNRACANDTYVIHTLPDIYPTTGSNGNSDVVITNISVTTGTIYVYTGLIISGSVPAFNPTSPLSGGWLEWYATGAFGSINYITVLNDYLCRDDGIFPIHVTAQAADSVTYTNLPVGIVMPFVAEVFTVDADEDLNNNVASMFVAIPGIDLAVEITGNPQGSYPGNIPGGTQQYEVTYSNVGTQASCSNFIEVTFGSGFIPNSLLSNFTTVSLVDSFGNPVSPVDAGSAAITTPGQLNVTMTNLGNNTYRFDLGTNPANVCLPAGSQGSFNLFGTLDNSIQDGSIVTTSVTIGEDSPGIEVVFNNNQDDTFVYVYRADLFVTKTGFSYMGSPLNGSATQTNLGETINYTVTYDNIGNTNADEVYLKEYIPEGTCYTVGTVEANIPAGSSVTYYDSNNNSIVPIADFNGVDCLVDRFELYFPTMNAPANLVGESIGGFNGSMTDVLPSSSGLRVSTQYTLSNVTVSGSLIRPSRGAELMNINGEIYAMFATEVGTVGNEIWHYDQFLNQFDYVAPLTVTGGATTRYDIDTIEIDNTWYAVIARNGAQNELMIFNTGANTFENILTASGALARQSRDVEIVVIQGIPYAIFANFNQANEVWKWDGGLNRFVNFTPGPGTTGAYGSEAVKIIKSGNDIYVGFANGNAGHPHEIWKWDAGLQNFIGMGFATPSTGITTRDMAGTFINGIPYFAFPATSLPNQVWRLNTGTNLFEKMVVSGSVASLFTRGAVFQHTEDGNVFVYWGNQTNQGEIWKYNPVSDVFDVVTNVVPFADSRASALAVGYKGQNFILNPTYNVQFDQIFRYNDLIDSYNYSTFPGLPKTTHQLETIPYDGDLLIVASTTFQSDSNVAHRLHIPDDGIYNVPIQPGPGFMSWDNLLVNEDIPDGTSITYTIYPDLSYTGVALIGPVTSSNGIIDLSAVATNPGPLGLQIQLHGDGEGVSPKLLSWSIPYVSSITPSFEFDVKVSENSSDLIGLNSIYNYVSIETITPEITLANNDDDETHYLIQSDVFVQKSISQTAIQSGDVVAYTIVYGNNGPNVAKDVVLSDIMPTQFVFSSSNPFPDNMVDNLYEWNLGDLQPYSTGVIVITGAMECVGVLTGEYTFLQPANYFGAIDLLSGVYVYENGNGYNCTESAPNSHILNCEDNTQASLPICDFWAGGTTYFFNGYACDTSATANPLFAQCNGGFANADGDCTPDFVAVDNTYIESICPEPDDILGNFASVTTTTIDTNPANNTAFATTVVGDYADVYTTVNCPSIGFVNTDLSCTVTYGNQGNVVATGGNVILDLDPNYDFNYLTGYVGGTCTYQDNRVLSGGITVTGTHMITCSGAQFSTVTTGFMDTMVLNLHVQNNYLLAPMPLLNIIGSQLEVISTISTQTPESLYTNNRASDLTAIELPLSTLAGNVYVDVFQNNQFTQPQDIKLANILVCLQGTTYGGLTVGPAGNVSVPCVLTNSNGNYSFVGLLPGSYQVYYTNSSSYTPSFSNAGFIGSTQVGIGSLQGALGFTQIDSIVLGVGEDSYSNDFGLVPVSCTTPLGLQVTSPVNNTILSVPSTTINGQISNLGATVTMNGNPVGLDINGNFSINQTGLLATNVFNFVATNGDTNCDEQYSLVINVNTTTPGGGGSSPPIDTCQCGDYSPSFIDGQCTETNQTWTQYMALYCPTGTGSLPPTDPIFPSAPIIPITPPEVELILPPRIPTVGAFMSY